MHCIIPLCQPSCRPSRVTNLPCRSSMYCSSMRAGERRWRDGERREEIWRWRRREEMERGDGERRWREEMERKKFYLSCDRAHFTDKLGKVSLSNEAKSHALPGIANTNINNNRRQSYLFPSGHVGKPSLGGDLSHLFFPQSTHWEHTPGQRHLSSSAHTNNIDISQLQLLNK